MKTYQQINEKIKKKKAVVLTAEEVIDIVRKKGAEKAAEEVDIVTTGTFGAMCSSGAFLNLGHADPPIRMEKIFLNGVEASGGLAAVDTFVGATQPSETIEEYGGSHLIQDLIDGKSVRLVATGKGTDCYVRKSVDTMISLKDMNEAYLYNPRNCYQNYGIATNSSKKTLHTYMGKLLPEMKNATYSSAGQLSPLLNDPHGDVIGPGTHIFLAGGEGYIAWQGTQFGTDAEEKNGVPTSGSRTLALVGDMKQMDTEFLKALDIHGYGYSIALGVGVPIPVLNKDVIKRAAISDEEIFANLEDYSITARSRPAMASYSYAQLRSGKIEYNGKTIRTSSLSSYWGARKVANKLKDWIEHGEFTLTEPFIPLPKKGKVKPMKIRGAK